MWGDGFSIVLSSMQTGDGGIGWTQAAGAALGAGLVVGVLVGSFWLKRRRREERRERPPQREKLLRPAGYWAMKQVDERWEGLTWALAQAIGAGVFFGVVGALSFQWWPGWRWGDLPWRRYGGRRGRMFFWLAC